MRSRTCTVTHHSGSLKVELPVEADVLSIPETAPLRSPQEAVRDALLNPIGSAPLPSVVRNVLRRRPEASAVIVVSDNTRPVPYRGEAGILLPVIRILLEQGVKPQAITILVAVGIHRIMSDRELRAMLDPEVYRLGIPVICHDSRDERQIVHIGRTARGTEIYINSRYMQADIKILTGLVESHFMAGASGGRKSICPGLLGERSTYVFHGPQLLGHPHARDLVLAGNPCHEEAVEVARRAGADCIINVTLNSSFAVTGVFAGEMEKAHVAAVEQLRRQVRIPITRRYDAVIAHAGYVGVNHYQAAKSGTAAMQAASPDALVIISADASDSGGPVGSQSYRTVLQLLKDIGAEAFTRRIHSPDWTFIPDQWQVQMWARLFSVTAMENLYFYAPQCTADDYAVIPGTPGLQFAGWQAGSLSADPLAAEAALSRFYRKALEDGAARRGVSIGELSVCFLADGPYGVCTDSR